ncbi:AI-2E family transporter [Clostridium carnis]
MFNKYIKYKEIIIAIVFSILVSVVGAKLIDNYPYFFGIIKKLFSLIVPFIYGLVIAYILNPLVKLLEKRFKLKSGVAILSTYILIIGAMSLVIVYCIPNVVQSIIDLTKNIPDYITDAQSWLNNFLNNEAVKGIITKTGTFDSVNSLIAQVGTMAVNVLEGSVSYIFSVSSQLVKIFLGILISIYVLVDKDRIILETKKVTYLILKEKRAKKLIEAIRIYHKMIGTYIGIKAIDSSIIGIMAFILLNIVKSEYAVLLACIVGITNMIPYFGPFIGEIVGFLFNVFVSPTKGLTVFLVLFALQMFDGWYLDPKLIGSKVGVRPFFIILAVVIGGGFFGPIGMLLASPTAATLKFYYTRVMDKNDELVRLANKE